jgi:hypothetical protein
VSQPYEWLAQPDQQGRDGWPQPGPTSRIQIQYRYLHEAIDVLADRAPDLHQVLTACRTQGLSHLVLDGTLIATDRVAGIHLNSAGQQLDTWYSGKHKAFGANGQFLSAPDGTPLGVSDAEPGPVNDITAAREHYLPELYKAAADEGPRVFRTAV